MGGATDGHPTTTETAVSLGGRSPIVLGLAYLYVAKEEPRPKSDESLTSSEKLPPAAFVW